MIESQPSIVRTRQQIQMKLIIPQLFLISIKNLAHKLISLFEDFLVGTFLGDTDNPVKKDVILGWKSISFLRDRFHRLARHYVKNMPHWGPGLIFSSKTILNPHYMIGTREL